jgi:hypothetical protein
MLQRFNGLCAQLPTWKSAGSSASSCEVGSTISPKSSSKPDILPGTLDWAVIIRKNEAANMFISLK